MKKGLLIIYAGPSGVGKSTVRMKLFTILELNLAYSISMTTRKIRQGETNGIDYFFVTREEFIEAINQNLLLEYAEYADNYYGTPFEYVEKLRNEGKNVMLEIEVNGALQVMKKCPDAISIFLLPPSMEQLEDRIRGRGSETEASIEKRMKRAVEEIELSNNFNYRITNDDIDKCADKIKEIILKEVNKSS